MKTQPLQYSSYSRSPGTRTNLKSSQHLHQFMSQHYRTSTWQVELPDGWTAEPMRRFGAVIYKPDGIGQLQVTMRPSDEMRKQMRFDSAIHQTFSGKLSGFTCQTSSGNTFSQTWCLPCGDRMIYVKYDCAVHHRAVELEEANRIVVSMETVE